MKALSTSLIKRWKKLLETGERTEKGGEKSKERNGEKERKVEKEKKGKEEKERKKVKVDAKEAARDSAREQTKDSYTGDEVRDRWLSKKRRKKFTWKVATRCRDLLLTAIWGEEMLVDGGL